MPTENRSSNTENAPCPFCGGQVDPEGWLRGDGVRGPECESCGATAPTIGVWNSVKPAEQHQGEPIGYVCGSALDAALNGRIGAESIAIRKTPTLYINKPLYTHADPGEVERLRAQVDTLAEWCGNALNKLADRDALLREALPAVEYESGRGDAAGTSYLQLADKIKSLFVSAEPSAPVEIDERADFERHVILTTGRPIDSELKRHPVRHDEYECRTMQTRWNDWQARAALDRKPS